MTLGLLIVAGIVVVAVAAIVALRMRQQHELALLATKPDAQREALMAQAVNVADLQDRVAKLEQAAAMTAGRKRRA